MVNIDRRAKRAPEEVETNVAVDRRTKRAADCDLKQCEIIDCWCCFCSSLLVRLVRYC